MKSIAILLLTSTLTIGCSIIAKTPVLVAASLNPDIPMPLARGSGKAWVAAVKEANRQAAYSLAGKLHSRVRVAFADGGWVDFEPSPLAIAGDSMPRLLAMNFTNNSRVKIAAFSRPHLPARK